MMTHYEQLERELDDFLATMPQQPAVPYQEDVSVNQGSKTDRGRSEYHRKWYALHAEEQRAKNRARYRLNVAHVAEKNRLWRAENPDKVKQYSHLHYIKNKEKCLIASRLRRLNNPEKSREAVRKHRLAHPEKSKEASHERWENHKEEMKSAWRQWRLRNAEKRRAYVREWGKANPEKRADIGRRRRAKIKGLPAEKIISTDIYKRDRWTCQLCKKKVNPKLKFPHPLSSTLDHIVPISKGGGHVESNVQLAHFACNTKARAGGIKQLRLDLFGRSQPSATL